MNNINIILFSIQQDNKYIEFKRDDKEIVLTAVKQKGKLLSFVSKELQNDKDVVLAAVKNYGEALLYASSQ